MPVHVSVSRLVVEMCGQEDWSLGEMDIRRIAEAFAIGESYIFPGSCKIHSFLSCHLFNHHQDKSFPVTYGSSFLHGSETLLGRIFDMKSNDLFTYILYQVDIS